MKSPRSILIAGVLALAGAVTALHAQIVHLSLQGYPTSGIDWPGSFWSPMSLDVYYDSALVPQTTSWGLEYYTPMDAANNFWRLSYDYKDESGLLRTFQITRPITYMVANEGGILATDGPDWQYHGFQLGLSWFATDGSTLPVPPISLNLERERSNYFIFDSSGLDVPIEEPWQFAFLAEGLSLTSAELEPRFTPVPEPATFGWFAAGGLVALMLYRRRRASGRAIALHRVAAGASVGP
jgi:hypothetical protein